MSKISMFVIILCVFNTSYAANIIYQADKYAFGPSNVPKEVIEPDDLFSELSKFVPMDGDAKAIGEVDEKVNVAPLAIDPLTPTYTHDDVKYIKGNYVGNFSLSGYCACNKCGTGTGITASGHPVREKHTIAADWNVLPKGTMIILENAVGKDGTVYDGVYEVEDKGGGIKNNRLDIYRPTHDLAALVTYYGKCSGDVYIATKVQ